MNSSPWHAFLANLSPAYFGLVMATGIISIGAFFLQLMPISYFLFIANLLFFITLTLLYALRVVFYPKRCWADFTDHGRSVGYFTCIAGTGTLSDQFMLLTPYYQLGTVIAILAFLLWGMIIFGVFFNMIISSKTVRPDKTVNGGWLLAVVACQSVATGSYFVGIHSPVALQTALFFHAASMWLFGCMLYIWLITLIFYRMVFFPISAQALSPTYWINMGATAITTLVGALLLTNPSQNALLSQLESIITGLTFLFWSVGTWWIPILVGLGIWRHFYKKVPLAYMPTFWGLVFPLGMYAACTWQLSQALALHFLLPLVYLFLGFALLAWSMATFALFKRIIGYFWQQFRYRKVA